MPVADLDFVYFCRCNIIYTSPPFALQGGSPQSKSSNLLMMLNNSRSPDAGNPSFLIKTGCAQFILKLSLLFSY